MHTGDFNWALIPSFLAALDRGSLMAAARTLDTSQPTVGRHIGELEAQLGVVLFERTGRGLVPTAHAHRLAEAARSMSGAADQLARQASGAQLEARGTVRISASQPVTCVLLPPLLRQMRELHPDIQIELVSSNAVSNLLQREADIALRMVRPDQSSLVAKRVGRVTIGTFAHRDYLRRRGTPRVPTDLLVHDLVGNDRNTDILRGFAAMGFPLQREDFAVRTDDLNAYQAAVTSGLGVGFLARYAVRENPELVPLLPMLDIPPLPMWLAVHREIRSNPRIRRVWDFLATALPQALA
ncbi:MAG: LysR family transcriptional regulator [Hydrogenophaga sp.]|jgi:DNA-binding transcriptional LysR family regulator|uniref:LysR family transcriptional regulator n=2 Tax=Hydrogenophaga sp. TaxID=1904254 RepID=UPI0025C0B7DC|nr:LysR family transcriptional regulator [Hydrogenophaga sp.]MDO9134897.1 LysR family transcriptional regulator [Hydrogenophaga sp.]MDO9504026.1 LysR family transcriptional regulator [Hydrogenophaga sp.]MDP1781835.1 LysR family transcriptional regulator [Hydrogenophaga sp.]MDP2073426.1 LysR family transcriptional regulator [Hydrogenophaga sp.]MDP2987765.1 LysR family transcriptional regulator [Hydrogenophaga sp.]